MKVWITRAEPGAGQTAKRLIALGHQPLVAPLLAVRPLIETGADLSGPDLSGIGALAFTSANGVRAFAELLSRRETPVYAQPVYAQPVYALPVFAVGEATADAARRAGFAEVYAGPSDVAALATEIVARRDRFRGAVLHPGAAEPAGDLAGALDAAGVAVRTLALYRTVAADPPSAAGWDDLRQAQAVLLHSPKAARRLADLVKSEGPPHDLSGLHLLGLSPACLAPLADIPAAGRHSAEAPTEADLLALLETLEAAQKPRPVLSPLFWLLLLLGALCTLAGAAIGFQSPHTLAIPPAPAKHLPPAPRGTTRRPL